jgi:hypothetical protein
MANVDKELRNAPATGGAVADRKTETPKKGLRGAAGAVYVGPVIGVPGAVIEGPASPTHATGVEDGATTRGAGGAEDSTSYRESDTYGIDGANSGGVGGADTAVTGPTRRATTTPSGTVSPTYYRGAGARFAQVITLTGTVDVADAFKLTYKGVQSDAFVAGTNMTAAAIQTALRTLCADPFLLVTGTTDAGPFIVRFSKPPGGGLSVQETVDTGSDLAITISVPKGSKESYGNEAGFALGSSGRGTNVDGETVDVSAAGSGTAIARPAIGGSENPSAGTVAVIAGTAKFELDMHADDVSAYAGVEVLCFRRGSPNTLEDGDFIGAVVFDSATKGDGLTTANVPALTAATYAVYARFFDAAGNVGPMSDRATVAVS